MAVSRGRVAGLVLLAMGPALVAAYAGAGHVAVRAGVRAQVTGPGWQGGRIDAAGMTSLGVDAWRLTWWTAAFAGLVALSYVVIGALLRRGRRGRTPLLVLSGLLIVPYALSFVVALVNPVALLARPYQSPDFAAGLPPWQPATAYLLLAAGLAQGAGLVLAAVEGRRTALSRPQPQR